MMSLLTLHNVLSTSDESKDQDYVQNLRVEFHSVCMNTMAGFKSGVDILGQDLKCSLDGWTFESTAELSSGIDIESE